MRASFFAVSFEMPRRPAHVGNVGLPRRGPRRAATSAQESPRFAIGAKAAPGVNSASTCWNLGPWS
jgi:hypothetical protein